MRLWSCKSCRPCLHISVNTIGVPSGRDSHCYSLSCVQVTNPPIDPLREGLVMSLEMRLGGRGNLLQPADGCYTQVLLKSPILLEAQLEGVKADATLGAKTFPLQFETGKCSFWMVYGCVCVRCAVWGCCFVYNCITPLLVLQWAKFIPSCFAHTTCPAWYVHGMCKGCSAFAYDGLQPMDCGLHVCISV